MAQADATLVGAVTVVTFGAIGLGFGLALAVALKGDGDGEGVLEAHRLNDEGFLLLFRATASSGLHTERDLDERRELKLKYLHQTCLEPFCFKCFFKAKRLAIRL